MDYEITVKVTAEEKTIEIPWEAIKTDYFNFIDKKADLRIHRTLIKAFKLVESRIRCVFLDRYKKYLIQ